VAYKMTYEATLACEFALARHDRTWRKMEYEACSPPPLM
jgi:hypothetical protein